jgi:Flp pilus assembly protein TadD
MMSADQPDFLCDQARTLIDVGQFAEAGRRLGKALALDPQSSTALALMSVVKLQTGEPKVALTLARQAVSADPDDEYGHRMLSVALRINGKFKQSVAPAREAARLAPEDPTVMRNLGLSLLQVRRFAEADAVADRLLELNPDNPAGHEFHGLVAAAQHRKDDAERHWRAALELNPLNPTYHNSLGLVLLERGRHADAVERFFGALQIDPKCEAYYGNLGIGLEEFRRGRSWYLLLFFLALVGLCLLAAVLAILNPEARAAGEHQDGLGTFVIVAVWGGMSFSVVRDFLRWRRQRKKVLPLLRAWRPRAPFSKRLLAGLRGSLQSPLLLAWFGLLLLGFGNLGAWSSYAVILYFVPFAAAFWFWIRQRSSPPVDEER